MKYFMGIFVFYFILLGVLGTENTPSDLGQHGQHNKETAKDLQSHEGQPEVVPNNNQNTKQEMTNTINKEGKEQAGVTKNTWQSKDKEEDIENHDDMDTNSDEDSSPRAMGDDELLNNVLISKRNTWSESYLQDKIKIRLVDKDWKPCGPSNQTDDVTEWYHWDVEVAKKSMEDTGPYKYEEQPLSEAHLLLSGKNFNSSQPSIMIIHPVSCSADCRFVTNTITVLTMRNLHLVYNIFAVDMPDLNFQMFSATLFYYMRGPANFHSIANTLANFFVDAATSRDLTPDMVHLIGFSYSAQLVGYMGRYIQEQTGIKVASILALDPIGSPNNHNSKQVNKKDAEVVHVYHTNSFPVGTLERDGTADFTFNDGIIQPECKGKPNMWMCSHRKVSQRFWYIILYGENDKFKARRCSIYTKFHFGVCDNQPFGYLTYPIRDQDVKGNFYLRTSEKPPYGLGDEGSIASKESKDWLLNFVENKNKNKAPLIDDKTLFRIMLI